MRSHRRSIDGGSPICLFGVLGELELVLALDIVDSGRSVDSERPGLKGNR